jgi:inosose dehydratase
MSVRVANAPLSYGAFEMTVGTDFAVPDPVDVLEAIASAGYQGTDLGPPGYLGEGDTLRERLDARALEVVGGFVPMAFSEGDDGAGLRHTLDLFDAAGAAGARPVLCDAGGPERIANPGRGGEDASLRLGDARWRTLADGVARAADVARERGYEPVFHHHTSTYVEGVPEIERFLEDTDVELLLDSGHLLVAGGDPVAALRDWGERIGAVHVKDVRLDVLREVKAERADTLTAWRRGLFCALGAGDVDLDGFCAALSDYDGWVVVEQDRVLEDGAAFAGAAAEQERNREWLREHAGW